MSADLEAVTQHLGRELLRLGREHRLGPLSARFWSDRLMSWAMKDPAFKVQLFRFVDCFPMLRSSRQVHEVLVEYLTQPGVVRPPWMDWGLKAGHYAKGLFAAAVGKQITAMAGNFIAGTDAASALPRLRGLWDEGSAFSVDLLGEACVSDEEARAYQARYLDLLEKLPEEVAGWPANLRLETDHLGPVPRTNVSIKISALSARTDAIDFEGSLRALEEALGPVLRAAAQRGVLVNFDSEQHSLKDLTLALFERCCEAVEFPAGLALQAYLRTAEDDARRIVAWSKRTGRQVTVRLVKGAYWDYEVVHAERMGWPVPVWTAKPQTDAAFERVTGLLLAAAPRARGEGGVKLALGSHNVRSIARALALVREHGLPEEAIELQMLYGMADQLKAAVLERGLRLRQYVPVGQMVPGMAYLVRRLLENTSNQSWLRAGFFEHVPEEQLLASPHDDDRRGSPDPAEASHGKDSGGGRPAVADVARSGDRPQPVQADRPQPALAAQRHQLSPAVEGLGDGQPFFNEPWRDFSDPGQRERFAAAVRAAQVQAIPQQATAEDVDRAVARAAAALPAWRDMDPLARSAVVLRAAAEMRSRRDELSALVVCEAGKTWREADADVCEAIDFCEFYARLAVPLFRPRRLGRFVGELDEVWHEPRGVAAIISPWNFPAAILTGMTVAALVTGNPAIVKPSGQTPAIAQAICEILRRAGVPDDVLQFLAGPGSVVGAALVRHAQVALIAFTGSKEVGLGILQAAAEGVEARGFVKKVVCEMGGKNAVIVDESADLDEAVLGVRHSAFGYSGQKCSACSRAIVVEPVYEDFLRRLVESTRALAIGDPRDPGADVGPVIDEPAARKIREYIEIGRAEGKLELACDVPAGLAQRVGKPYIGPHIFSGILPEHRLAREEIFGPVLAVMRARDFQQALDWANAPAYKLTGGVFSRKPSHLARARREFRVGNLYLNRGITGALVGRQPFGGFGLSGTGTQAGGADYLLHFVEPRACCENTMRHGFAPGIE